MKILRRSRRTLSSCSRQSMASHSGPRPRSVHHHGHLTCPSVPAYPALRLQRLTRHTSACFRSRAPGPVSGRLYGQHPAGGPVPRSHFPAAFRPPALASWASCSRQGTGLPLRWLTGSAQAALPDPDGVSTFRTREMRPGRVSSLPRERRCSLRPSGRPRPPSAALQQLLLPPRYRTPTRDIRLTRHRQGFRVIHPSGLPLTCRTRSERAPSGFPLSFAPGRYQPRTSGRGQVWTQPEVTSSASCRTSNRRTYS